MLLHSTKSQADIQKTIQHSEKLSLAFKIMSALRKAPNRNTMSQVDIPRSWGDIESAKLRIETLEDPSTTTEWCAIHDKQVIHDFALL